MLGKLLVSCTFQRTWCSVWIALVGWWGRPSLGLLVWWGHYCIPIICRIWWRSTILVVCWWGQRWGEGGRHSWWYGYWGTDSLGRHVISRLPSFWQRRRVWPGEISRGRFFLFWGVLQQTLCRLDVRWDWVGRLWPIEVQMSPWVWWCGHMV